MRAGSWRPGALLVHRLDDERNRIAWGVVAPAKGGGPVTPRPTPSLVVARALVSGSLLLTLAACGPPRARVGTEVSREAPSAASGCVQQAGFAVSLASGTGGQPTPTAAATWFVSHGGIPTLPAVGWRVVDQTAEGATLRSGTSTLHVVRGSDGTWQVDSGTHCA